MTIAARTPQATVVRIVFVAAFRPFFMHTDFNAETCASCFFNRNSNNGEKLRSQRLRAR